MRKTSVLFLQSILAFFSLKPSTASGKLGQCDSNGFIFKNPPFKSCHASTLTETAEGDILCSWFAGKEEGASDVAIWISRLKEGKWEDLTLVAKEDKPCWNPVLFTLNSGEILLFYKAGSHPQVWSGFLKSSKDHGRTWSVSLDLPAGVIGPVKNRPLMLEDQTLLCGSSWESWRRWGCWVDITQDQGKSWMKSNPINVKNHLFGIIQPALFFSKNGSIRMVTRSYQIGRICTAESKDQGRTWSEAKLTNLPNPNSSVDAINLQDGRVLLIYNHSETERYPLNLAISEDGGDNWTPSLTLESKPGEYSYPCLLQTKDGKIHISYTWNRIRIKHITINPSDL